MHLHSPLWTLSYVSSVAYVAVCTGPSCQVSLPRLGPSSLSEPGFRPSAASRPVPEQLSKLKLLFSTSLFWRYEEEHHNCYSYTLTFINCILTTEGKEQLDKNEFTEKFVVPRTRKASKYITLYRVIEEHGFYVTDHPGQEPSPPLGGGLCWVHCVKAEGTGYLGVTTFNRSSRFLNTVTCG